MTNIKMQPEHLKSTQLQLECLEMEIFLISAINMDVFSHNNGLSKEISNTRALIESGKNLNQSSAKMTRLRHILDRTQIEVKKKHLLKNQGVLRAEIS